MTTYLICVLRELKHQSKGNLLNSLLLSNKKYNFSYLTMEAYSSKKIGHGVQISVIRHFEILSHKPSVITIIVFLYLCA